MKIYVFWLILILADVSFAQQVIVNADGTHSIVHSTGNGAGVVVNPNGTHSTIHPTGSSTGVIVNANGTHSTFHSVGQNLKVIVNANGTHSTFYSTENNINSVLNPNSTRSLFQTMDSEATTSKSFRRQADYESNGGPHPKWWKARRQREEPAPQRKR